MRKTGRLGCSAKGGWRSEQALFKPCRKIKNSILFKLDFKCGPATDEIRAMNGRRGGGGKRRWLGSGLVGEENECRRKRYREGMCMCVCVKKNVIKKK